MQLSNWRLCLGKHPQYMADARRVSSAQSLSIVKENSIRNIMPFCKTAVSTLAILHPVLLAFFFKTIHWLEDRCF